MIDSGVRRVLLVGFMGAGKSSVGRRVADHLGWTFIDLDAEIERRAGLPIPEIFGSLGEAYFRTIESEAAEAVLARESVVVAPGGGWAAAPGRLSGLPEGTRSVWLSVSPEESVRRVSSQPGQRPLLTGTDVLGAARRLIEERAPFYRLADVEVDTDGLSVEDVSARILDILSDPAPSEHPE